MAVCRLCFNNIEGEKISILDILEALHIFMPELNHSLVENPVICENCLDFTNAAFTLLYHKVDSDMKIDEQLQELKVSKIDTKIFNKNKKVSGKCDICRMCLKSTKNPAVFLYDTANNTEFELVTKMLEECCIPLNLDVCYKPVMCTECLDIIQKIHTFKAEFLNIETILEGYCEYYSINSPLPHSKLEKIRSTVNIGNARSQQRNSIHSIDGQGSMAESDDVFDKEEYKIWTVMEEWCKEKNCELVKKFYENISSDCANSTLLSSWLKAYPEDTWLGLSEYYLVTHAQELLRDIELPKALSLEEYPIISEDHFYAVQPLNKRKDPATEAMKKANFDLVKVYLEVTWNEKNFKLGYHDELRERWLKIHPEWPVGGESLGNFAHHLIRHELVPNLWNIRRNLPLDQMVHIEDEHESHELFRLYTRGKNIISNINKYKFAVLVKLYLQITDNRLVVSDSQHTAIHTLWTRLYRSEVLLKGDKLCIMAKYILKHKILPTNTEKGVLDMAMTALIQWINNRKATDTQLVRDVRNEVLAKLYLELSFNEKNFENGFLEMLGDQWSSTFPETKETPDQLVERARSILNEKLVRNDYLELVRRNIPEWKPQSATDSVIVNKQPRLGNPQINQDVT